jgi:hypothetical protein
LQQSHYVNLEFLNFLVRFRVGFGSRSGATFKGESGSGFWTRSFQIPNTGRDAIYREEVELEKSEQHESMRFGSGINNLTSKTVTFVIYIAEDWSFPT